MRIFRLHSRMLGPSLAVLACFSAGGAWAQTTNYLQISAGTGFLINRQGDVVTNAHVVKRCQSITVLTEHGAVPAKLIASDPARDLAVLRTPSTTGEAIASLRWNIDDLRVGDDVVVMGYPGQQGVQGQYQFKKTSVISLAGPTGEPQWIQLASVAQHGNSGGPVLDSTGNVIAVISGLAMTYRVDQQGKLSPQLVGQSDVAITLAQLQDFLHANHVPFYEASSGIVAYADGALEDNAHKFIVPVHCVQGVLKSAPAGSTVSGPPD